MGGADLGSSWFASKCSHPSIATRADVGYDAKAFIANTASTDHETVPNCHYRRRSFEPASPPRCRHEECKAEAVRPWITVFSDEKFEGSGMTPYEMVVDGQTIKFCCKNCVKDFNKDTKKYLKKLADAEKKAEKKIRASNRGKGRPGTPFRNQAGGTQGRQRD